MCVKMKKNCCTNITIFPGDEIWTGGFGSENILSGKIVDANTKFNIGSLTKAFTATLLGTLLSERGYTLLIYF